MECVSGNELGLPLLTTAGTTRRHRAERITWHAHEGFQLLFLLRGATAYEFKRPTGRKVEVPGGHFLLIPPGRVHRGVQDMRPPCELCSLVFAETPRSACRNTPFTPADWRWLCARFRHAGLSLHRLKPELARAVRHVLRGVEEFRGGSPAAMTAARLRLAICETLLTAASRLADLPTELPDQFIQTAQGHLRARLEQKVRMADVARQLGVTRSRLFELFRRDTGMTPNDFLLRARVEKARQLLADTRRSVTDIAFDTGFGSSQYFSTVFRKYTGSTPLEFREQRRSKAKDAPDL
jgi:AraC-like DNA-binding protein